MIVSMHQPNYIPWLGYFYKIYKSDVFVIADDVQYTKHSYINRNKIKTSQGSLWLTAPVNFKNSLKQNINQVKTKDKLIWKKKHLRTIEQYYKKAEFFNDFYELFRETLLKEYDTISDLNISMIKSICKLLGINTEIILSSELNVNGKKLERIINICKAVNVDIYLSGQGAKKYNDLQLFEENNIKLVYTDFKIIEYDQLWGDFIGNMSVIDYIFNCGFDIKKVFK